MESNFSGSKSYGDNIESEKSSNMSFQIDENGIKLRNIGVKNAEDEQYSFMKKYSTIELGQDASKTV